MHPWLEALASALDDNANAVGASGATISVGGGARSVGDVAAAADGSCGPDDVTPAAPGATEGSMSSEGDMTSSSFAFLAC